MHTRPSLARTLRGLLDRRKKGTRENMHDSDFHGGLPPKPTLLHRFLAFPRYMHYRRRGKILSHFSFPSLFSAAAAFVRFCDLAVRRRMINDISLSTAGCCCWMVARCRRRRRRRRRRAMQLPPLRHAEIQSRDSSSEEWRSG